MLMDLVRYACSDLWHFAGVTLLIATFGWWGMLVLLAASRVIHGRKPRG